MKRYDTCLSTQLTQGCKDRVSVLYKIVYVDGNRGRKSELQTLVHFVNSNKE